MVTPLAAAIYARISSDPDGTALGVNRQLEDCRKRAAELGWTVAEEYVDNDLSAYSGKNRPAYEAMLADLAEGGRDGVLAYHIDRLTRRPIELEQFLATIDTAGVSHVQFVSGVSVDVGNGDGLLVTRLLGNISAHESATKSRRQVRKNRERAEAGLPHGGHLRPFGFEPDRITHRADEAEVIRQLVARYLAGESAGSLTTWLEANGVATVSGKPWKTTTVRGILANPRHAGICVHQGVEHRAVWEPIITDADHRRVLTLMESRKNSGRRVPQRYLLSGLLLCGKCGNRLFSSQRKERNGNLRRRYVCQSGPDHGGCGKLTIVAEPLEELISRAVLWRLDTPELSDALAGKAAADSEAAQLSEQLADDKQQLDDLAAMFAAKQISAREWMTARNPIQERIEHTERRIGRLTRTDVLAGLPGNGAELAARWDDLGLDRQHAIVQAVLDHAVIGAGTPGARGLDPGRVDPVWRL